MQAFIETVVKGMVSQPDEVRITTLDRKGETIFQVRVHPDDVGRLVGRRGSTINAIRTLLTAGAARKGLRCSLDLVEDRDSGGRGRRDDRREGRRDDRRDAPRDGRRDFPRDAAWEGEDRGRDSGSEGEGGSGGQSASGDPDRDRDLDRDPDRDRDSDRDSDRDRDGGPEVPRDRE